MKRIIAAIAVVAIVSSAFAFNAKKGGAYCASLTNGGTCNIVGDVTEKVNGTGTAYFKFKDFDGTNCNASASCTTATTLYPQP